MGRERRCICRWIDVYQGSRCKIREPWARVLIATRRQAEPIGVSSDVVCLDTPLILSSCAATLSSSVFCTRKTAMRAVLVLSSLALAVPALAEEPGIASDKASSWRCSEPFPGGPRVCGSNHSTYVQPRVVTEVVEVDRPVPVPVPVEQPVTTYVPYPVYVPKPHHRPPPRPQPQQRQLRPNHF